MTESQYVLSFTNVKNIPFDKYEANFTFIVNGKRYLTNRIIADILSPIIRQYHYQDSTINEFSINICSNEQENLNETDYFQEFINLCNFDVQKLNETHKNHYKEYFLLLGNISEYFLLENQENFQFTTKNVIDNLSIVNKYKGNQIIENLFDNEKVNEMIKFAAEHFDDLPIEKLVNLDDEIIERIIGQPTLKLKEEDSLLNFVLELYMKDSKFSFLFDYVIFKNVKEETWRKFIDVFDIEYLNQQIWQNICQCFFTSKEGNKSKQEDKLINGTIDGIMKYLVKKTGGNIHDNKTIQITSNDMYSDTFGPKNLVDYDKYNFFASKNRPDCEIIFDFKDKQIEISSYSIKSIDSESNGNHLRNWVIEISNDGNIWEEIDRHEDDSSLNGSDVIKTFSTKKSKFTRFVKLRQTGRNWCDNYSTNIYSIDFNGQLKMQ